MRSSKLAAPALIKSCCSIIIIVYKHVNAAMNNSELDRKIDFAERKVLLQQDRVIQQKEKVNLLLKSLERQARSKEEMKKEWIRKLNVEQERVQREKKELYKSHRETIEDLRLKYEREREDKLRDLKILIQEEEKEINEWRRKRDEAIIKTKAVESQLQAKYQGRLNALLREEQSAIRTGVVRQKRLLEAPNVFSMSLDKRNPVGMKKRMMSKTRLF